MVERLPFRAVNLKELDELLTERIRQVQENFQDESYPDKAKREINLKFTFVLDKETGNVVAKIFSSVKLPARYGKKIDTAVVDGEIMVERGPKDQSMFSPEVEESVHKLRDTLTEAGATMKIVTGGNVQ